MKLCDVIGQKWIQLFCLSFSEQNHQVDVSENDWNAKLCERNNLLKIDEGKYWWKKSRLCGVAGTMFVRAVPSSLNTNEMSNTPMKIACLHHILRFSFMWHDSNEIVLAHLSQSHHTHTRTHTVHCVYKPSVFICLVFCFSLSLVCSCLDRALNVHIEVLILRLHVSNGKFPCLNT